MKHGRIKDIKSQPRPPQDLPFLPVPRRRSGGTRGLADTPKSGAVSRNRFSVRMVDGRLTIITED